jgi:hypothetical protein
MPDVDWLGSLTTSGIQQLDHDPLGHLQSVQSESKEDELGHLYFLRRYLRAQLKGCQARIDSLGGTRDDV